MQRISETEVMDTPQEASEYDAMDFTAVNTAFAQRALLFAPTTAKVLDAGTGTARIPILISQQRQKWQITAIDLSPSMLAIGQKNVAQANLQAQIHLEIIDVKQMPYQDHYFDLVLSNSLIHHLGDPLLFLHEIKRVLKPKGGILLRDLLRPTSEDIVQQMVEAIGSDYSPHQKQLFRDSLRAAYTLEEIQEMIQIAGLEDIQVYQSSDQHWTAERLTFFHKQS